MRRVFWFIYTTDKNMSLLQGRPSYLRDSEVDAWHPRISPDVAFKAWDELFILGIKFAKLQSQVYDQLYSTSMRHLSRAEQDEVVNLLSDELQSWYTGLGNVSFIQHPFHPQHEDLLTLGYLI